MKILIAYGSKRGGTQGLAQMLGRSFVDRGADVVVEPADAVRDVAGYDAVVVVTAHDGIDWQMVADRSSLVVDLRNVVPPAEGRVWKL